MYCGFDLLVVALLTADFSETFVRTGIGVRVFVMILVVGCTMLQCTVVVDFVITAGGIISGCCVTSTGCIV